MKDGDDDNLKRLHELEQSIATVGQQFPYMWRRMYENMRVSGFSADEAMALTMAHVHGSAGGKFTPK